MSNGTQLQQTYEDNFQFFSIIGIHYNIIFNQLIDIPHRIECIALKDDVEK